jgi:hypothetical protein
MRVRDFGFRIIMLLSTYKCIVIVIIEYYTKSANDDTGTEDYKNDNRN